MAATAAAAAAAVVPSRGVPVEASTDSTNSYVLGLGLGF